MTMASPRQDGATPTAPEKPRVLLAEDQVLVAMYLETLLEELACTVLGPASSVAEALAIARQEPLNGAVLDINLRGEPSFPIAQELQVRPVPFFFVTGYSSAILPPPLQHVACLNKPVSPPAFAALVKSLFQSPPEVAD
jgi:CheY-like chemotaxis protein